MMIKMLMVITVIVKVCSTPACFTHDPCVFLTVSHTGEFFCIKKIPHTHCY